MASAIKNKKIAREVVFEKPGGCFLLCIGSIAELEMEVAGRPV
jgi:hypothetical protein